MGVRAREPRDGLFIAGKKLRWEGTDLLERTGTQATLQAVNHAPVIAGPDSVSFAENDLSAVATYTATDADGADTLEWQAQVEGRANGTPMELVCWFVQGYLLWKRTPTTARTQGGSR